jgi:MFS family permease
VILVRVDALRTQLAQSLAAFRDVFRNRDLRRIELAFATSETGEWAAIIALSVYAYDAGGAGAVALVGFVRLLPATLGAPFTALLADRQSRIAVMLGSDLARAAAMGLAAACAFAGLPAALVFALAALVSLISTAFRPAQAAVLPSLARSPTELTAANVASSTVESVASFAGPAVGGIVVALTSPAVVFAGNGVAFAVSALLLLGIGRDAPPGGPKVHGAIPAAALAGFRTIALDSRLRVLVGLAGAQTLVAGALNVLVVVAAYELLDAGDTTVGWLYAALGVGGVAGAFGALGMVGQRRLAAAFGVGVVFWGAPIALMAAWTDQIGALILLAVVGAANTVVDVASLTLIQRTVPDEMLGRVFGVLESLIVGGIAVGSILAAPLVAGLGVRGALIATGLFLPILAALVWRRLMWLDELADVPEEGLAAVRAVSFFAPLPGVVLEELASSLVPVHVDPGEEIVRQGEPGDRFFLVAHGRLDVVMDGRPATQLGPGDYFGEIALMRDVPRTATVRARDDVLLYALERDQFLSAVTGYPESAEACDAVVATRLARLRPRSGPL